MIDGLHGEVERHKLDDRFQSHEGSTDAETGETNLRDRRVSHALGAKLLQQTLRNLVRTLIIPDFLAHDEHLFVARHLFAQRAVQRVAHRHPRRIRRKRSRDSRRRGRHVLRPPARSRIPQRHSLLLDRAIIRSLEYRARSTRVFRRRPARVFRRIRHEILKRADVFFVFAHHAHRLPHRNIVRVSARNENLRQIPILHRLHLHHRLIRLHLGQNIPGRHGVALRFSPTRDPALSHRRR